MWEGLMVSTFQCCRFAWWRFIRVKWFHHIQCLKSTNMSVLYWLPEICIHVQNMTWNPKACNQIWQLWIHWQFALLKKWQLSQTTHATIFTDSMNLLQKLQSKTRSSDLHLQVTLTATFEGSCACTALDLLGLRKMSDQKCWGAWDTSCWLKAKDLIPLIPWKGGA